MSKYLAHAKYEWHEAITSCGTINRGIAKANWASKWAEHLMAELAAAPRTRDREIARMARDSGINALIRFAEMLEADAPR